ncbi:MAG: peroxide stress protein YaaA [Flavobacteriales bacterium]|nr:peroxide stress protein YaaA [Flavobacteriales bacterium]
MLSVISPAKRLDFSDANNIADSTNPMFIYESSDLVKKLRKYSAKQIGKLMSLNSDLSELNYDRYQNWSTTFNSENSKQAVLAFSGEVYRGMNASSFEKKDFDFAQDHLRILSGLHGVLRPLDLIHPYRLEMGTKLKVGRKNNLYEFWQEIVSNEISIQLDGHKNRILINLASNEYIKAVNLKSLDARVVTPVFKDWRNGEFKSIMTYAKVARGLMTGYIIKNRIEKAEGLKDFSINGYSYNKGMSSEDDFVFTRKEILN